ncbi:MAG: hypothetical protein HC876_18060, partial [Chloroflexaceae bacterium]|nr:hypothetical protein [Chloroflexaceae bacterium]
APTCHDRPIRAAAPTATPTDPGVPAPTQTQQAINNVGPVLDCVVDNGNGTFTAYFGYNNTNSVPVSIPIGLQNSFNPGPADRGQPSNFAVGRTASYPSSPLRVNFASGQTLTWRIGNSTASAGSGSSLCNSPAPTNPSGTAATSTPVPPPTATDTPLPRATVGNTPTPAARFTSTPQPTQTPVPTSSGAPSPTP